VSCPKDLSLVEEPSVDVEPEAVPTDEPKATLHQKAGYLPHAEYTCSEIAREFPGLDTWTTVDEAVSIVGQPISCGKSRYYIVRGASGALFTVRSDNLTLTP
jgi:hypothetical protein